MSEFHIIVEDIFYNILKYKHFKILEKKENSMLFFNGKCYLFVGQHMGETFVNLSKDKKQIISPFMWAVINKKIDYKTTLPLICSQNIKLDNLFKCSLSTEKTLISLFCQELLDGDFSKSRQYFIEFEKMNEELYSYYQKSYYSQS